MLRPNILSDAPIADKPISQATGGRPNILVDNQGGADHPDIQDAMFKMSNYTNPEKVNDSPVIFPTYETKVAPTKGYGEDLIKRATENLKQRTDYSKVSSFERYSKDIGGGFIQGLLQTPKALDDLVDLFKGQKLNNNNWTDKLAKTGENLNQNIMAQVSADPTFADQLAGGIGSMGSFLVPSTGFGKVAGGATKLVQLFKGSEKMAEWVAKLTAQTSMTALESSMESGSVYDMVYQETGDEKKAIKMAESTAISNAILLGVTNRFSGYFEHLPSGAKNAVKRVLSAFLSEGSQEGGQQIISNLATGKDWSEGVKENALIGGIIGSGATLATANVFDDNGNLDIKKVEEVIDKTKEVRAKVIQAKRDGISKEEVVGSVAEKNDISQEEAQSIVDNVMNTVDTPFTEKDFTEQQDALISDVKTALDSGSRISAISKAIVDQYNVSPEYADSIVQKAIADSSSVPTTETNAQDNTQTPKETIVGGDISQITEKINELTDKIPTLPKGSIEKRNAKIALETERAKLRTLRKETENPVKPVEVKTVIDTPSITQKEKEVDETFPGEDISKRLKKLGTKGGVSTFLLDTVKKEDYVVQTTNLNDLIENDLDLKEYIDNSSGKIRRFTPKEESKTMHPIVTSKGEVWDGYNRIAQAIKDGKKEITIFKGVSKKTEGIKKETKSTVEKAVSKTPKKKTQAESLSLANEAKINKILDTKLRMDGVVASKKEHYLRMIKDGGSLEQKKVEDTKAINSIYKKMEKPLDRETKTELEKELADLRKPENYIDTYRINTKDGSFYELTKLEYVALERLTKGDLTLQETAPNPMFPEKTVAEENTPSVPKSKNVDVGEKIGGARKDTWGKAQESYGMNFTDAEIAKRKLSELFPKLDYKKLSENGVPEETLMRIAWANALIVKKPTRSYAVKGWVEQVKVIRKMIQDLLENKKTSEHFNTVLDTMPSLKASFTTTSKMYTELDFINNPEVSKYTLSSKQYTTTRNRDTSGGYNYDAEKVTVDYYTLSKQSKSVKSFYPEEGQTIDSAMIKVKDYLTQLEGKKNEKGENTQVDIKRYIGLYNNRITGKVYSAYKKGKTFFEFETFNNIDEARTLYRKPERLAQYIKQLEEAVRFDEESFRTGESDVEGKRTYRTGNVSAEEFQKTFGFRGVEFGNWVNQSEREVRLNKAFDSFKDLSSILGIPDQAISLNGELGFAFGARGSKGALAHYESGKVVINITKLGGAGTLAHEWFHAFDNYLSRRDGSAFSFATEDGYNRAELDAKLKAIVDYIKNGDIGRRSQKADNLKNKVYYGQVREMTARGFEVYVKEKLLESGLNNTFLVSLRDAKDINPSHNDIYPYAAGDEITQVTKLYQDMVDTLMNRVEDNGKVAMYKYKTNLTTKILKDLEGKTTVSKQYILDATNRGELKQVERDLIRQMLEGEDVTVNVADFTKKVQAELLPLTIKQAHERPWGKQYEQVVLPDDVRGKVKDYNVHIFDSPIKTSAGNSHFPEEKNYFGHTRIEDMADNQTRRVIEVQSDLYQKGNLEKEQLPLLRGKPSDYLTSDEVKRYDDYMYEGKRNLPKEKVDDFMALEEKIKKAKQTEGEARNTELSKLAQYNDPTAHFRMIREEVAKASEDGKMKLQFPTGETAMKIEGLGDTTNFFIDNGNLPDSALINEFQKLSPNNIEAGQEVFDRGRSVWIITDVLGDGKFKAVPKDKVIQEATNRGVSETEALEHVRRINSSRIEEFDISGKVDTNNPIYKFYEKEVGRYLKNNYDAKTIIDDKGVAWYEIDVKPEYAETVFAYRYKEESLKNNTPTVSGAFLEDAMKRLKIDFDYKFFDAILGEYKKEAWGVTKGNAIALEKNAPFITERHEFVHLTLKNLGKIDALKHINKFDLLMEQTAKMGLPIEMYDTPQVEEALAKGIEQYERGEETVKSNGKIKQFYDYLIEQIKKFTTALGLSKGNIINEYYDILLYEESVNDEYIKLSTGNELTDYVKDSVLDLSEIYDKGDIETDMVMMKQKLDDVNTEYNNLVTEITTNQEMMSVISRYTDKAPVTDIVKIAKSQVKDYVKAVLEIKKIKQDITDASELFAKLVAKRENIEDLQNALESKLIVITTKTHGTKGRPKITTETVIADAIANEDITSEETATEVVKKMTPKKKVEASDKKISAFQHRMLDLLSEQNRDDITYNVMHKVEEVAKAEAYYEKNKKRTINMALGKETAPDDVSSNVIALTVLQKAKEENDAKTIARVLPKLSLRATKQGQEISMLANAFGERDPLSYMNKLIAQRKLLAQKKYKPFFSSTKDAKSIDEIVQEKVKQTRKRAPKLSDLMQTKVEDINSFLDNIKC